MKSKLSTSEVIRLTNLIINTANTDSQRDYQPIYGFMELDNGMEVGLDVRHGNFFNNVDVYLDGREVSSWNYERESGLCTMGLETLIYGVEKNI